MQRRDFVRSALFGTGAACALALPSAYAALKPAPRIALRTTLARLDAGPGQSRWRALDECSSAACGTPQRMRVAIDALGYPVQFRALAIDAMFDTDAGIRPFRIAHYQPGSLSPSSKPFSFESGSTALAGFRIEHAGEHGGSIAVASSAMLGAARPVLAAGRYLLIVGEGERLPEVAALPVPANAADALVLMDGSAPSFAWLGFSVHAAVA